MTNKLLRAALRYARRGWPVLPLHNPVSSGCSCESRECGSIGKHPRTAHGLKDAATDESTIRGWWRKWPKANIGIATGSKSGIVVLDIDPRHDGSDSFEQLRKEFGALPRGPRVRTGGNGQHIFLEYPGVSIRSKSGIFRGIDVRGDGGYVVAPPSLHASGKRYRWRKGERPEDLDLAPMPGWLLKLNTEPPQNPPKLRGENISLGDRNSTLTSLAGGMRRQGAGNSTILAALREHNDQLCDPPLDDAELKQIASGITRYPPKPNGSAARGSQSTQLVELAGDVDLFHTPDQELFGTIEVNGHFETWKLSNQAFKRFLASRFYAKYRTTPSSQTLQGALGVLEGRALYEGAEHEVFTRVGQRGKSVYVDLCDQQWRAIKITKDGWKIVSKPRIRFRRARGMKALPLPEREGSIAELRRFLNVPDERHFKLLVAWTVGALNPRGPYPVLVLQGEAGCGKSTTARIQRELVDPSRTPLRSEPRENRDLMIAARNAWTVCFDNVSNLKDWLSDALCQIATGGGFATRQLFTDAEEEIFEATRPILLNGIEGVVTRGDLMDRAMIVFLPVITDKRRKPEEQFWKDFRKVQPRIFGVLLNAVACALRRLPHVKLDRLPRMADFARWVTAAEPALGWVDGDFINAYDENRIWANLLTLEACVIVAPLRKVCAYGTWKGTAQQLLNALCKYVSDQHRLQRDWPKNAQVLSIQLRRIAPNLRATGLDIKFGERTAGRGSKRIITITHVNARKKCTNDEDDKSVSASRRFQRERILRFPRERK